MTPFYLFLSFIFIPCIFCHPRIYNDIQFFLKYGFDG